MNNNCFVIMPYGLKKDVDGREIDFDEIYEYIIQKAVKKLKGFECIRCDNINESGWIHKRMIQHIFEDRVAIVDTSTLNANVFYELGVRQALRKGVTVLIQRKGTPSPFNIAGLEGDSLQPHESPRCGRRNQRHRKIHLSRIEECVARR